MNLNLNQREKLAISGAGVFLIVFIMVQWLIVPVFEKRDELKTRLDSKKNILVDMKEEVTTTEMNLAQKGVTLL